MDVHQKSQELLEKLANALYDRGETVNFTVKEVRVVDNFLQALLKETLKKMGEY
jgi:hypothetical protein